MRSQRLTKKRQRSGRGCEEKERVVPELTGTSCSKLTLSRNESDTEGEVEWEGMTPAAGTSWEERGASAKERGEESAMDGGWVDVHEPLSSGERREGSRKVSFVQRRRGERSLRSDSQMAC